jgi:hypothetical protein
MPARSASEPTITSPLQIGRSHPDPLVGMVIGAGFVVAAK